MKNKRNIVVIATFILFGLFFIRAVWQKENTIHKGRLVLLELAPVDPRSLMQGDYMQLNYALNSQVNVLDKDKITKRGYITLALDRENRGVFKGINDALPTTEVDSFIVVKYFNWDGFSLSVGADSYFFQEGKDTLFEQAKYGGLRVDDKGNSVLIGLYKENLERIE
ncbi:GDYXXLXY domain-containing protein [Myroides fluvii]|uniref:GDYXXLXY domain-containing protein n=1 Tax=Myroides fluvii TaxID=2572594 RepID=UPI00131B6FEB|nr:GDYXXLXY domain-containing protein [Myroides fluvii]